MKCDKCQNDLTITKNNQYWICLNCGNSFAVDNKTFDYEELFYNDEFKTLTPIIAHEYSRIYTLLKEEKYYGVLLQIKDFAEVLLKFPIVIALNYIWTKDLPNDKEIEIIKNISGNLSLGTWVEIGRKISKLDKSENIVIADLIILLDQIVSLYNNTEIVKWRNENIGHGALSFELDSNITSEMNDILNAIKKHLTDNKDIYSQIQLIKDDGEPLVICKNNNSNEHLKLDFSKLDFSNIEAIRVYKNEIKLFPFIIVKDKSLSIFDSFNKYKLEVKILDYINGNKQTSYELLNEFLNKSKLIDYSQFEEKSINEKAIFESEMKAFDTYIWGNFTFVKPDHITRKLRLFIETNKKGVLLIEMERGMGKSTFSKFLSKNSNKYIQFKNTEIRTYCIDNNFNYSVTNFRQEAEHLLKSLRDDTLKLINTETDFTSEKEEERGYKFAKLLNDFNKLYKNACKDHSNLIFIIDGIDEIPYSKVKDEAKGNILDYIPDVKDLDNNVYVIVTSRKESEISDSTYICNKISSLKEKEGVANISVSPSDEDYKAFINQYINKKLKNILNNDKFNELKQEIIKRSNNKILYLSTYCEIFSRNKNVNLINEYINGDKKIMELYKDVLKKMYGSQRYFSAIEDIMLSLAIINTPLTLSEISVLIGNEDINYSIIGIVSDLSGVFKIERSNDENLYSIHEEFRLELLEVYATKIEEIIKGWIYQVRDISKQIGLIKKFEYKKELVVLYSWLLNNENIFKYNINDIINNDEVVLYFKAFLEEYIDNYSTQIEFNNFYKRIIDIFDFVITKLEERNINSNESIYNLEKLYYGIASSYKNIGDKYNSEKYFYKFNKIQNLNSTDDIEMKISGLVRLGDCYYKNVLKTQEKVGDEAIRLYNQAIKLNNSYKNKYNLLLITPLLNLTDTYGDMFIKTGEEKYLKLYNKYFKYFERIIKFLSDDEKFINRKEIYRFYYNMAKLQKEISISDALKYIKKAKEYLSLDKKAEEDLALDKFNSLYTVELYNLYGEILQSSGVDKENLYKAEKYYKKAIEIINELYNDGKRSDIDLEYSVKGNISYLYRRLNRFTEAEDMLDEIISYYEGISDKNKGKLLDFYTDKSTIKFQLSDFENAFHFINKSLELRFDIAKEHKFNHTIENNKLDSLIDYAWDINSHLNYKYSNKFSGYLYFKERYGSKNSYYQDMKRKFQYIIN